MNPPKTKGIVTFYSQDNTNSVPAILMADRGYESFNVFAHLIQKDMKFVIRMKDINSNGILSAYDLPDGEFDTYIRTTLTRRHTKETLGNPDIYIIIQPATDFDFLNENCTCYDIEFRIVRILGCDVFPAVASFDDVPHPLSFRQEKFQCQHHTFLSRHV